VTTDIATTSQAPIAKLWSEPEDRDSAWSIAQKVAKSGLAPSHLKTPEAVFVAMAMGAELGLTAMASLRAVYVVDGKPSLPADLMVGLVLRSGLRESWKYEAMSNDVVRLTACRVGGDPLTLEWTFEMAETAGLTNKHNWKAYRRTMLKHRVDAEMCRALWPDIIQGLYDPEELRNRPSDGLVEAIDLAAIPSITASPEPKALDVEPEAPEDPAPAHVPLEKSKIGVGSSIANGCRSRGIHTAEQLHAALKAGDAPPRIGKKTIAILEERFGPLAEEAPPEAPDESESDALIGELAERLAARPDGLATIDFVAAQLVEDGICETAELAFDLFKGAIKESGTPYTSHSLESFAEAWAMCLGWTPDEAGS
jgi:hypothetical protein